MNPSLRNTLLVAIAVTLFALSSPVIKLLVEHGAALGLTYPDAISFCNVLFVGNLAAGLIVMLMHGAAQTLVEIREISGRVRLMLALSSLAAVTYPALLFIALEQTTVTNVVLLSRFEGIFFALIALAWYGTVITPREGLGYTIIGVGVGGLVLYEQMFELGNGEWLVLIASLVYAVAIVISKEVLAATSLRTFLLVRNLVSAAVFYVIAVSLYGFEHFADAFRGELWILMAIYALLVIVVGQSAWFSGVRGAAPATVARITLASPFLTLLFAFVLLGEIPELLEAIAMGIILAGMLVGRSATREEDEAPVRTDKSLAGG